VYIFRGIVTEVSKRVSDIGVTEVNKRVSDIGVTEVNKRVSDCMCNC